MKLNACISIGQHNYAAVLNEYDQNLHQFFTNEANRTFLDNLRKYLTIVSSLDYNLTDTMQKVCSYNRVTVSNRFYYYGIFSLKLKVVEADFVNMRQNMGSNSSTDAKPRICVDDFHLLMVIARLQTLSNGRNELSIHEWNKAKNIEKERKERLK
jgi:hypothetical protein